MKDSLQPAKSKRSQWIGYAWLAALYLAGIFLWGYFFSWGKFPLNLHDWADISGPRLTFLKDAITQGELPLHISDPATLNGVTDRFLSIPDQILSPQIILLRFISIGGFALADVLFLYSLGFGGLLWLRRRFRLSPAPFTILFVLFNFNGHILAHFTVGHLTWGGYFLFPWFAILIFQLLDGERGWGWIAKMALLLFAIFLQGAFHQYVWALIFLAFLAAVLAVMRPAQFLTVAGGGLFAILLSLVRILPPALLFGQFETEFYGGYQTLAQLWESLVTVYPPGVKGPSLLMPTALGYWEFSLYVGLAGALFLLFFGAWRWLARKGPAAYLELLLPVITLTVLSIGRVYGLFRFIPVPLLDGERVSSRIISLPFVFLLILAVIEYQRWLEAPHPSRWPIRILTGGAFVIGLHDLWQNFGVWRIQNAAAAFKVKDFASQDWSVTNHPDPAYVNAIIAGAILSLASLAILLFFTFRSRRQASQQPIKVDSG